VSDVLGPITALIYVADAVVVTSCAWHCLTLFYRCRPGKTPLHNSSSSMYNDEAQLRVYSFVCLSVWSHNSKTTRPNFTNFYARCLRQWISPPLTALQYIVYFRFCGWLHVFT